MTNPQALREALEEIKALAFRPARPINALDAIRATASQALSSPSTTVATAATPADARAIVEVCARVIADLPWDDSEVGNANFDDTKEYAVKHLRAKAPEIIAALPKAGEVPISREVFNFLKGIGPLDGCHFRDKHPTERGAFWWRKHLAATPPSVIPAAAVGETLPYQSDDWKLRGYPNATAEIEDMANVGRALMAAIEKDFASHPFMKAWHPADCPTEIVGDLLNALDEATPSEGLTERYRAALERIKETVKRRGLPITGQVYEIADEALAIPENDA